MEGVNYFPLDVHLEDKVNLIEAEFGLTGFAVLIKLYQKIYGGSGYFTLWDNEVEMLFSSKINIDIKRLKRIVEKCIERDIFSKDMYDNFSILTSKGIQKRFFTITKRRKESDVKWDYILLNKKEIKELNLKKLMEPDKKIACKNDKNANKKDKNVCNNEENACKNEQSKVKESKVNKSKESKVKEEKKKYGDYGNVLLTDNEYNALRMNVNDYKNKIKDLDYYIGSTGREYKSHYMTILSWSRRDKFKNINKSSKIEIEADREYETYSDELIKEMMMGD
ncbi:MULTISPECIES: DUF4373 domain-containing protein [Anaerofustis]|uniref:DUF4373 domain-containing protein n=1 Tax=Anaerofustis TaxID=264995 RepID=UPI001106EC64|nr:MULTISPECIES: DUF4373 domain-containing protein [Anaerofustis]MCO8193031.1 DUF4373 domain-containing protein [Anaerofustis sp. NSJ-163]